MKITLLLAGLLLSCGLYAQKNNEQDRIVVIASAESNLVMAGQDYIAYMLMMSSLPQTNTQMWVNRVPIQVHENGVGEVRFKATGRGRQKWIGMISANVGGKDTAFRVEKEYEVIEPVMRVEPTSKMILYKNCENELHTNAPLLGPSYRPAFSIDNGMAVPGKYLGTVVLYPSNLGECKLTISSGGNIVGITSFQVLPAPVPYLTVLDEKYAQIDDNNPIERTTVLKVVLKPDENFLNLMPKEANYRVSKINYALFRNGKKINEGTKPDAELDLKTLNPQSGDILQITVGQGERISSRGQTEAVTLMQPKATFFIK